MLKDINWIDFLGHWISRREYQNCLFSVLVLEMDGDITTRVFNELMHRQINRKANNSNNKAQIIVMYESNLKILRAARNYLKILSRREIKNTVIKEYDHKWVNIVADRAKMEREADLKWTTELQAKWRHFPHNMENLSRENYKDFILYDLLSSGRTMTKYPFNAKGLNTTFRYMKDLLNDKHPDIMAIAETWLNDEHANNKDTKI